MLNAEGKIWLQTRALHKTCGGKLDYSASGHIGAGDSYEKGAYRELKEEIGIKTKLTHLSKISERIDLNENRVRHVITVYTGKHDGPFKIQKDELEKIECYDVKYIKNLVKENSPLMTKGLKLGLTVFFEKKGEMMLKIIAIGGGSIKKQETNDIDKEIMRLTEKKHPNLLFIPTASIDNEGYVDNVKKYFGKKLGCKVDVLYLINEKPSYKEIKKKISKADCIYVGGGNTLSRLIL